MHLTAHDQAVLRLASQDAEGCLTCFITEDGSIALKGKRAAHLLRAEDSLPKLEELGLLIREVSRSYVLTPQGWESVEALPEGEMACALSQQEQG
jgi:hypothetical protein